MEGLTSEFPDTLEQTPPKPVSTSESEEMEDAVVPYKKLLAQSSLSGFELRLFQKEPPLVCYYFYHWYVILLAMYRICI